ncbi:MAG: hypothetical protein JSS66_03985 [Armatimonadetes bacterium]|nr:hypothetical protein [Armatimonadota bacterium]
MLTLTLLLALAAPQADTMTCGWLDEMNNTFIWKPIAMENQPEVYSEQRGLLSMRLPHVPDGWPYAYQWSGVTRDIIVDLDRYPVLVARVSQLQQGSYAHLDIAELDIHGKESWTTRSTTLQTPGLSVADVGKERHGVRRLRLRLIVGGPNEGCSCSYSYVRFVSEEDQARLQKEPDWSRVRLER